MESYSSRLLMRMIRQKYLFLMMAPAFILVFLFNYATLSGWVIAFKHYEVGQSMWGADWAGWYHFRAFLFENADYVYLLRNTLIMNLLSLVVSLLAAVVFAILINELKSKTFVKLVQSLSFFPFFISWVIVYSAVNALLAVSGGAVNETLVQWGVLDSGLNILGDPKYAWGLVVFLNLWKTLGYNGVIFIAAIAAIPADQYEAAEVDGANRWHKIRHVTLPNLMPTLVVLLIMNSGWILNSNLDMYFLFSNATNYSKMEVLDIYIYNYGLKLTNYSYVTAVGIMKSFISIALILGVNALAKRVNGRGIM